MKHTKGFALVGVMVLGAMMTVGFFVALSYKRIIEQETALANIRHTGYIIEDSMRTSLALLAYNPPAGTTATTARTSVIQRIRNSTQVNNPAGYIRMAIPNSVCDLNGRPCNVFVKNVKFIDDATCDLGTMKSEDCPAAADDTVAKQAVLAVKAEYFNRHATVPVVEEKGAGTKEIVLPIPRIADIQNVITVRTGNLLCSLANPIFQGTEIVTLSGGIKEIRAKCGPITPKSNSTVSCAATAGGICSVKRIGCAAASGYWLTGINQDLSAKCDRFPAGTGTNDPVIPLCSAGQVSTGFRLNQSFQVSDIKCRDKGGPYDFEK